MRHLLLFARLLRDSGLSIAPSEIADAQAALKLLQNPEPGNLHFRVLQASLIKRVEDQPVFRSVYGIFFANFSNETPSTKENENGLVFSSGTGVKAGGLPTLARALLTGEFSPCKVSVHESVLKVGHGHLDVHEVVRQALVSLDYFGAVNSLRLAKDHLQIPEWDYQEAITKHAPEFVRLVEQEVIKNLLADEMDWQHAAAHLNWRSKSFNLLSQAEMGLVKRYLEKIGKKLAVRNGLRNKIAAAGDLNFRVTINRAMATGGSCYNLVYSRKAPLKPELILLCDISNSVYQFTSFMLQLVAAFRQRFEHVKAFVFVDCLWQVPDSCLRDDVSKALEDIRENNRCSITGLSDFGRVFEQFHSQILPTLSAGATLIILGDGKNNWRPLELGVFKEISNRMKKVYWLNPLPQEQWGTEDCQIAKYQPFCSGVFECGNLSQLENVAMSIF